MTDVLLRVRRALLGMSAGLLAAALLVEVPSQVLAQAYTVQCSQTICTCTGNNCTFGNECGKDSNDNAISCYCHDYGETCPCEHY